MLTAVVTTRSSGAIEVAVTGTLAAEEEEGAEEGLCQRIDKEGEPIETDPAECPELNPIAPEAKEMIWGFGAFVVMAVVIRYLLFPKIREGMSARYDKIHGDQESAETLTAAARADVAEYEARLASVRAEAQAKVDAARATLETERSEQVAAVNARIAEKRAAAQAEVDAARAAARGDVEGAVADVVSRATEIATGRAPDAATVQSSVQSAMGTEVSA